MVGDRLSTYSKNRARDLLIACLFVEAWLVFLHFQLALHATPTVRALGQAFNLTRESSIATYWSCLLTLATGVVCFVVANLLRQSGASKFRHRAWIFSGIVFVCLSIDDAVALHEKIGAITSLELTHALNYPSYAWHISVAPVIVVALILAALVIWREIRDNTGLTITLLLSLGCFTLALGLDFMGGIEEMAAIESGGAAAASQSLPILMVIEEVLEMAGMTIMLFVVYSHMTSLVPGGRKSPTRDACVNRTAIEA